MRFISWTVLLAVLLGAVVTVGAAAYAYVRVRQEVANLPIALPEPPQNGAASKPTTVPLFGPTRTPAPPPNTAAPAATQAANAATAAPTPATLIDPGRVTILLLGTDHRKGETDPPRTDTIMLLSIDPVRKTATMLSIPRDVYIPIPGFKPGRINEANPLGESAKYPGGGPALSVKAVQSLVGVPIQRYVMIDFDVFTTAIDAVGPIRVCPDKAIHDSNYPDGSYGIITVDFPAGCQDLDSTKLLQYSRVRHNAGDDFGRAARQQEVIRAVREKVLSLGGMSALLVKAGQVWGALKDSLKTDMTFDEMIQLAQVAQSIPKENIQSAVLTDKDGYLLPATLQDGSQVFTPIYEKIHNLVATLFDAAPASSGNPDANSEGAKILVSNGAGVDGMAKATADKLRADGFPIVDAKNADLPGGYGKTIIRVFTGKVKTAGLLAKSLNLDGTAITPDKNGPPGIDIEVVVGKDLVPAATAASP